MGGISAEAAVTRQVNQDKPSKKKKSSSFQEIIREAQEAEQFRTFHGFQTPIGHGGRSSYGPYHFNSGSLSNGVIHASNGTLTLVGYNSTLGTVIVSGGGIIGSSTSVNVLGAGTLTLSGTNLSELSNPSNVLTVSNSSSATWSSSNLTITGWNGNGLVNYGNGDSPVSQLSLIQFINPSSGSYFYAVPEPSVALLGTTAALFLVRRRR